MWTLINFPTGWEDIDMFERLNKTITVNVLGYNDEIDNTSSTSTKGTKGKKMVKSKNTCYFLGNKKHTKIFESSFSHFMPILKHRQPTIGTCPHKPPKSSYTMLYQNHVPVSFSFHLRCSDEIIQYARENNIIIPEYCSQTFVASGEDDDVSEKFVDSIEKNVVKIYNLFLKDIRPMVFTEEDRTKI